MAVIKADKILIVIDPELEAQPALDKAIILAKAGQSEITLLTCEYTQYLTEGYYFDAAELINLRAEYLNERLGMLEKLAEPLRAQGFKVDTLSLWGHPGFETIVAQAVKLSVDLIIHHVGQHGAISRVFLSHGDWQLVSAHP